MRQITVAVPDKKLNFFKELVESLGFNEIKEVEAEDTKRKTLQHIEQGLRQVKMIRSGKLPKNKIQNLLGDI